MAIEEEGSAFYFYRENGAAELMLNLTGIAVRVLSMLESGPRSQLRSTKMEFAV